MMIHEREKVGKKKSIRNAGLGVYTVLIVILLSFTSSIVQAKEVNHYVFGHSLFTHDLGSVEQRRKNVAFWLSGLAKVGGHQYKVSGQFGQLTYHAFPPQDGFHFDSTDNAWNGSFANTSYNSILLTPANYETHELPNIYQPYWKMSWIDATLRVIDLARVSQPDVPFYIYETWHKIKQFSTTPRFTPNADYMKNTYYAGDNDYFHNWHMQLHDSTRAARPALTIKMIPVGPIISKIFNTIPDLHTVPYYDYYEDEAPHGRASIYFLSALVFYSALYQEKVPANYAVSTMIVEPIRTHFQEIIDIVWSELNAFNYPDGTSRVFLNKTSNPVSSSSSQSASSSSLRVSSSSRASSSSITSLSSSSQRVSSSERISSTSPVYSSSVQISLSSDNNTTPLAADQQSTHTKAVNRDAGYSIFAVFPGAKSSFTPPDNAYHAVIYSLSGEKIQEMAPHEVQNALQQSSRNGVQIVKIFTRAYYNAH